MKKQYNPKKKTSTKLNDKFFDSISYTKKIKNTSLFYEGEILYDSCGMEIHKTNKPSAKLSKPKIAKYKDFFLMTQIDYNNH